MSNSNITPVKKPLSLREQAEAAVREEMNKANLAKLTDLIRQREKAKQVVNGIEMQIADLEAQISDGTN